MAECWRSFEVVSLGLQKHSPLEPLLSGKIAKMVESGLTNRWIDAELDKVGR
jgi:hypothetical protein